MNKTVLKRLNSTPSINSTVNIKGVSRIKEGAG
jgi:hypothetical protein